MAGQWRAGNQAEPIRRGLGEELGRPAEQQQAGLHDEHGLRGRRGLLGQDDPDQPWVQRADQVGGHEPRGGAMQLRAGQPDVLAGQHSLAADRCVVAVDVQDVH
ncbi:MAG TPA: hypothetical protein VIK12_05540 [Pengzhenrongella sp.]